MQEKTTFGSIIKERRQAIGLTQVELARRVGCAPITVRKIEYDALRPSVQIAERLAMALGIPENEQLGFIQLARQERPLSPIPTPSPMREEIGQEDLSGRAIRGYQLGERIGAGGFGVVYRAVQATVDRDVAVKIILPRYADHPDFIRRFESEAQMVAHLEHPHIVPLYDYWREPGSAYLIMRYLRGGSLEDLLRQGALSLETLLPMMEQVCLALHTAHLSDAIHRDIKPANILLDEYQNAYLADFGIAKNVVTDQTQAGVIIGSPAYISPEQIRAEPIRPQADIYALGIMVYELLTGQKPFPGPTPVAFIQQHLNEHLPLISEQNPDIPFALDKVLVKATAKNQADRYPDALSMLAALQQSVATSPIALTPTPPLDLSQLENPYKGLRPFMESDTNHFYGREMFIQSLLMSLSAGTDLDRFLAVVGPSGSGKSSVVRAGLIPALRQGGLPGSDQWFIVEMTPGSHPFEELEASLLRVAVNPPDSLATQLQENERGLLRAVKRILPPDPAIELVLLIDQFEELFTLTEDEETRTQFLDSLVTAVLDPRSRLRIIITMRADFIDRPLQYVDFGELIRHRAEFVLPLTPDELEQVIVQPVVQQGMSFEPGLTAQIVRDVGDEPGTLPLLQYALTELFEKHENGRLTRAAYEESGGVLGALGDRADKIYQGLSEADQAITRQLFMRLVTLGEGAGDTRRRVPLSELEELDFGVQDNANEKTITSRQSAIINEFGKYRLLAFDRDPITRAPTVEVSHEALLREWKQLRMWLLKSRDDIRLQRALAVEAAGWAATQDDSYLLRGSRLAQYEGWRETTAVVLTTNEQAYLQASVNRRERIAAAEDARRGQELETARKLAKTEKERAETERKRAEEQTHFAQRRQGFVRYLAGALVIAFLFAVAAGLFGLQSNKNANIAATRQVEALSYAELAATREAEAIANANIAATREVDAQNSANLASTREAEALDEAAQRAIAQAEAVANEEKAVEAYSLALAANAREALLDGDAELATLLALAANTVPGGAPLDAQRALMDAAYAPAARRIIETGVRYAPGEIQLLTATSIVGLDISPDGKLLASGSDDSVVRIWDLASGEVVAELNGHTDAVLGVAFSPNGRQLLSGSTDRTAILWNLDSGAMVYQLEPQRAPVRAVTFTPDGRSAIIGMDDGNSPASETIRWDLTSGEIVWRFGADGQANLEGIHSVAISPDGRYALIGASAATVQSIHHANALVLWDVETGQPIQFFAEQTRSVNGVDISPDGRLGLSASDDGLIRLWDLESGVELRQFQGHEGAALSVAFSPDGRTALSGSLDRSLIWWDVESGRMLQRLRGHTDQIYGVAFTDESSAVSTSFDGTTRQWDLLSEWRLGRFGRDQAVGHQTPITALDISPDGRYLLSGAATPDVPVEGEETTYLILWDYESGEPIRTLNGHGSSITGIAFLPDSRRALTAEGRQTLILWDVETGEMLQQMEGHADFLGDVAVSSDGAYALSTSEDRRVIMWDLTTGEQVREFVGHQYFTTHVAFSADDRQMISSSLDGTIIVWDVATGRQIKRLNGLDGGVGGHIANDTGVMGFDLGADGRSLLTAGNDKTLLLWDLESGQSQSRFLGHSEYVYNVAYTDGGDLAFSSGVDDDLILWDVETAVPIRRFRAGDRTRSLYLTREQIGQDNTIAVHSDGKTAVSGEADGSILKWQLAEPALDDLLAWLPENRHLRELTCRERALFQIEPLCDADGGTTATTTDLITAVSEIIDALPPMEAATTIPEPEQPLITGSPAQPMGEMQLGDNRGELAANGYDAWSYNGKADELLSLQMVPDNPVVGYDVEGQLSLGQLPPFLHVIAPDGTMVAESSTLRDLGNGSVTALLPLDGEYRIEARSLYDAYSGSYTLSADSKFYEIDPEMLQRYTGVYQGASPTKSLVYFIDGKLIMEIPFYSYSTRLVPVDEHTFFVIGSGTNQVYDADEEGNILGYMAAAYKTRIGDLPEADPAEP